MANDCENLHISYDEFHENIGSSLLALQKDSFLVDVTLACQDGRISAHKVILAASSLFFQSVLKEVINRELIIYLKGVKVKYLNYLIDFIYSGNVDVPPTDLHKFLELGQELKVKGLAKKPCKLKHYDMTFDPNYIEDLSIKVEDYESIRESQEIINEEQEYENNTVSFDKEAPELGDVDSTRDNLLDPSCSMTFSQDKLDQNRFLSQLLTIMQKTNLKGPKGFQWSCLVCGKVYLQRNHLQEHVEIKHVKGVIHSCTLCNHEFTQSKHLKYHVKTFHEDNGNQNIWQYAKDNNRHVGNDNESPESIKQEEPPCKVARMQEHVKFKMTTI